MSNEMRDDILQLIAYVKVIWNGARPTMDSERWKNVADALSKAYKLSNKILKVLDSEDKFN